MASTGTAKPAPSETSSGASLLSSDCPKGNSDLGTKIGLSVGIPLSVLVLVILGFFGWREWRKNHAKMATYPSSSGAVSSMKSRDGLVSNRLHTPDQEQEQILTPQYIPVSEMSPRPRYLERNIPITYVEADGRPGRQEMPS